MTNRERLAMRLERMVKLLRLEAPHTILLSEFRMIHDAWMDCEQYGYQILDTRAMREIALNTELDRIEREHKTHLDKAPDPDCEMCQEGIADEHPDPERNS